MTNKSCCKETYKRRRNSLIERETYYNELRTQTPIQMPGMKQLQPKIPLSGVKSSIHSEISRRKNAEIFKTLSNGDVLVIAKTNDTF